MPYSLDGLASNRGLMLRMVYDRTCVRVCELTRMGVLDKYVAVLMLWYVRYVGYKKGTFQINAR